MIRVLLAEDSPTARAYLASLIESDPALELAGLAVDGADAVDQAIRSVPDVILMDVHMPRLNGLEATRRIMERVPTPIVLVSASLGRDEVFLTFEALKAGAVTVVQKPPGFGDPEQPAAARKLLERVRLMAEVKVVKRWPPRPAPAAASDRVAVNGPVHVIAIGASTGGPPVLAEILGDLPRDLRAAILVVQHIAKGFTAGFAEWLASQTKLCVKLAEDGEPIRPGIVYVAPEGVQLEVDRRRRVCLTDRDGNEGYRPSASCMFASLASSCGSEAMGVVLTGMGRDGAAGLRTLRDAGAATVAQSEATSVVFGMPGEALRSGAAERMLDPPEIARLIRAVVQERNEP